MTFRHIIYRLFKAPTENAFIQLIRYGFVGGIAFAADFGSLYALTDYAGIHYQISAALAFIIGLTVNYFLSIRWVFNSRGSRQHMMMEFIGFAIVGIIGLGLNALIMYLAVGLLYIHYLAAKLFSTAIVFFWNFLGRKLLTSNIHLLCRTMPLSTKTAAQKQS